MNIRRVWRNISHKQKMASNSLDDARTLLMSKEPITHVT
jgi:hypothetical protein